MQSRQTSLGILLACVLACTALGEDPPRAGGGGSDAFLRRFDANGDGTIDDAERRAVREKLRQRQAKPGAMTPSGETETVGDRLVTEMDYASSDGRKIPCVLSMPQGEGPFPVLVTIHGGQGNRDLDFIRSMAAPGGISPTVTALNEQPWAILAISYRAGNGALFGMEHDDVIAGIRFAKTLPKVDPDRVGVVGGSHGGHLALVAAEKMGREFLCVAAGSPWMTDPVVYMTGDPDQPPLSAVPAGPRDALVNIGRKLFENLQRGRGMTEQEAREFLARQSIEAHADKIEIPTLFLTSRGDDQVPHALVEPMIEKMRAAGKEVEVYTADKSPHGFYWARTVGAARALRGEKTPDEAREEEEARRRIIDFFTRHFARKAGAAPARPAAPADSSFRPAPAGPAAAGTSTASRPVTGPARTNVVRIASGDLVGEQCGDIRVFRGIPYAAPPVGPRRWKAPEPPVPWEAVREAVSFGPPALQAETFTPRNEQSEDCLFLMGIPRAHGLFHKAVIHSSGGMRTILTLAEAEAACTRLTEWLGLGAGTDAAALRRLSAAEVVVGMGDIRRLGLPVKPVVDGRLVTAVPEDTFAAGEQARVPVLIGAANGESGGRDFGAVGTGGAFGFQRGLADAMDRVGQPVWMFQLTFVPPEARASRSVARHGESVAYAFGTIGGSVASRHGFRDATTAARALASRRGGGVGRDEEDPATVDDSREGREISAAMMAYLVSFMRNGRPAGEGLPEWPQHTVDAPRTMVFGNDGLEMR